MTKIELNDKLAELYGLYEAEMYEDNLVHLIDDWNMLMPLALQNKIGFVAMNKIVLAGRDDIGSKASYSDHENIEAAAQYAIAMALVKLAESKP